MFTSHITGNSMMVMMMSFEKWKTRVPMIPMISVIKWIKWIKIRPSPSIARIEPIIVSASTCVYFINNYKSNFDHKNK